MEAEIEIKIEEADLSSSTSGNGALSSERLFAAPAVLTQALLVAMAAERHHYSADTALKMASTQSGDSDSVAAIAGSLIGVMGMSPSARLIDGLNENHRNALYKIAGEYISTFKMLTSRLADEKVLCSVISSGNY